MAQRISCYFRGLLGDKTPTCPTKPQSVALLTKRQRLSG